MTRFKKLLEPYYIGNVKTRNRIVRLGAGTLFSAFSTDTDFNIESKCITEKHKAYYEALARGGVGLIIHEAHFIINYPPGSEGVGMGAFPLPIGNDTKTTSLIELTQLIHKYGCPIFLPQGHMGPWSVGFAGLQPVSSSPLTEREILERIPPHTRPPDMKGGTPRGLTIPEIKELVNRFALAAERAKEVGFDGVQINAGTCHLGNSFLSRAWNRRHDEYGCDNLENRARFVVEIIQEIKKRAGQDFPIIQLFNIAEFGIDKGTTIEEGRKFARIFENAGADAIEARVFGYGIYSRLHWPEHVFYPEPPQPLTKEHDWSHRGAGANVPLAAEIKKVVSIPVIVEGRLDPKIGEKALQEGKVDFIGMARRLLADTELPNKVASGRSDAIAPCTACHHCTSDIPVRCRVNAALGNINGYVIKEANRKKKVIVVGGGPAGLEAARVAALRGHEVILYEKEHKLGGLLSLAALVKGVEIEDLPALVKYFKNQITKLGVKIRLGKGFNLSLIREINPDVVILATGGVSAVPEIPGINSRNVVSGYDLHRRVKVFLRLFGPKVLRWLTKFWMPLGKRVVIIGGDIQGCELAEFLVKRGRKVTILDTSETLGAKVPTVNRVHLLEWLIKKGVTMLTGVKYEEITDNGLAIITREGKKQIIETDTIVPAMPLVPNTELLRSLEGKVPEIHTIGDCRQPGLIVEAIADGWRISQSI